MGKSPRLKRLSLLAILVTGIAFCSCKDDVFSPEKVKATYQDKFPVKDIDPDMDWKLTNQISVTVSVYEDYGVDYTVRIYTENPLDETSGAKLLAEGVANNEIQFQTIIDCPSALQMLYAARYDAKGRAAVKPVDITSGNLTATFGWEPTAPSSRAASTTTRAYDATGVDCPYTEKDIKEMLGKATEYTADLVIKEGSIFKISGDYKGSLTFSNSGNRPESSIILIIAPHGKWTVPQGTTIPSGVRLIVAGKGEVKLSEGGEWSPALIFKDNSSLVILGTPKYEIDDDEEEGDVDVDDEGEIKGDDGKSWIQFLNTGLIYNRGEIKVAGIKNTGSTLYNYGELDLDVLVGNQLTVNHGSIATDYIGSNNGEPQIIENYCIIDVEETCNIKKLIMGPSSYLECDNFYPGDGMPTITLEHGSFIKVEEKAKFSCHIVGPSAKNEYALLRIEKQITDASGGSCNGMIYFEVEKEVPYIFKEFITRGDKKAVICGKGKAPAYIPAGNCSGLGNTPSDEPDPQPEGLQTYTYVFEDNFPLVGDYDFNDVVLDVTVDYDRGLDNKITTTRIDVKLAAAGASKTLGAGLRIVGNDAQAAIGNISIEGADKDRFQSTLSGSMFSNGIESDQTIPLFGNAHGVFGVPAGTLVNTGRETAPIYTCQIKIEQKNNYQRETPVITKDNLDFFIAYKYRTMEQRVEVHLYEFWGYGATAAGTIQKENLDLAGNNTWAICVPNFSYPKENINISDQKDESDSAYPLFLDWARNRDVNQDWYMHPNKANVYR